MKLFKVWTEFDINLNIDDHHGVYSSKENLDQALSGIDWEHIGKVVGEDDLKTQQDFEDAGFLVISEIEG